METRNDNSANSPNNVIDPHMPKTLPLKFVRMGTWGDWFLEHQNASWRSMYDKQVGSKIQEYVGNNYDWAERGKYLRQLQIYIDLDGNQGDPCFVPDYIIDIHNAAVDFVLVNIFNQNNQLTDHGLVDNIFSTSLGLIHAYSYNLLARKCITFRQAKPEENIIVRLNFPLSWIINNQKFNELNNELLNYGVRLRKTSSQKLFVKEELELIDISTQQPSKMLPLDKLYLETESEFTKRLSLLGELIGKKMQIDSSNNEIVIFSLQELHNDDLTVQTLMDAVNLYFKDGLAGIHYKKIEGSSCFPAILYNKHILEPVPDQRTIEFTAEFTDLIRGKGGQGSVRQLSVCALKKVDSHEVFLAASYHADYATINQNKNEKLMLEISNLALNYGVVLGGDFNIKIENPSTFGFLKEGLSNKNINVKMKSTPPGLQLNDTIDAVFVPRSFDHNKSYTNVMGYC